MHEQLPLPFSFNAELGFREFHAGPNAELIASLQGFATGEMALSPIFIWGNAGTGKTHLLNACCTEASKRQQRSCYIPLDSVSAWGAAGLEGLEEMDLVCLDNLEAVVGTPEWEAALFLLFNQLRDKGSRLAVSATAPPSIISFHLPDLQSRLCSGLTFRILPLDDADKLLMLEHKARALGLTLTPTVARFLLARNQRDIPSLALMLENLDRASLAAQRKLTIPFIKSILGDS